MLKMLDLFSGIGGFSLAASWTGGIETVAFCEIEPYCQKVLKKHWPDVPIFPDIKELRGEDIGQVDIICGGFPCQPFSCIGQQKGKQDDRYLWPEMLRVIQEIRPTWVVGENVTNFVSMGLDNALSDLESAGYETAAFIISAIGIGAKHPRERIWIIGNSNCQPSEQTCKPPLSVSSKREARRDNRAINRPIIPRTYWEKDTSEFLRVADGLSSDVDRRRGLGNSIVPQVVYPILQGIVDIETQRG